MGIQNIQDNNNDLLVKVGFMHKERLPDLDLNVRTKAAERHLHMLIFV